MSAKVKVIGRVRPPLKTEAGSTCIRTSFDKELESPVVELFESEKSAEVLVFRFDAVYQTETTKDIFAKEIKPFIGGVFEGNHRTIFAHGMSGSGKTFTMQGTESQLGISYLSAQTVFELCTKDDKILVSMLEIYKDKVFDLINVTGKELPVREDNRGRVIVANLQEVQAKSYEHFKDIYHNSCSNRKKAATKLNTSSSRSHAVTILKVLHKDGASATKTKVGKILLVDLAGNEDNRKTGNTSERMLESSAINTSLFVLNKVITSLNAGHNRIPYRDSKLTRLLQDSLGGTSQAVLIATLSPSSLHYLDTRNTLEFASSSRRVVNHPEPYVEEEEQKRHVFETADVAAKLASWKEKKEIEKASKSKGAAVSKTGRPPRLVEITGKENQRAPDRNLPEAKVVKQSSLKDDLKKDLIHNLEELLDARMRDVYRQCASPFRRHEERIERIEKRIESTETVLEASERPASLCAPPPRLLLIECGESSAPESAHNLSEGNPRGHAVKAEPEPVRAESVAFAQLPAPENVHPKLGEEDAGTTSAARVVPKPALEAKRLVENGNTARKHGDLYAALRLYEKALTLAPDSAKLVNRVVTLRKALGLDTPADTEPARDLHTADLACSAQNHAPVIGASQTHRGVDARQSAEMGGEEEVVRIRAKRRRNILDEDAESAVTDGRLGHGDEDLRAAKTNRQTQHQASKAHRSRSDERAARSSQGALLGTEPHVPGHADWSESAHDNDEGEASRASSKKGRCRTRKSDEAAGPEVEVLGGCEGGQMQGACAQGKRRKTAAPKPNAAPVEECDNAARSDGREETDEVELTLCKRTPEQVLQVLNTGTLKQLIRLHGIAKKRAENIIQMRHDGHFTSIDDLHRIGMSDKMLLSFRERNIR